MIESDMPASTDAGTAADGTASTATTAATAAAAAAAAAAAFAAAGAGASTPPPGGGGGGGSNVLRRRRSFILPAPIKQLQALAAKSPIRKSMMKEMGALAKFRKAGRKVALTASLLAKLARDAKKKKAAEAAAAKRKKRAEREKRRNEKARQRKMWEKLKEARAKDEAWEKREAAERAEAARKQTASGIPNKSFKHLSSSLKAHDIIEEARERNRKRPKVSRLGPSLLQMHQNGQLEALRQKRCGNSRRKARPNTATGARGRENTAPASYPHSFLSRQEHAQLPAHTRRGPVLNNKIPRPATANAMHRKLSHSWSQRTVGTAFHKSLRNRSMAKLQKIQRFGFSDTFDRSSGKVRAASARVRAELSALEVAAADDDIDEDEVEGETSKKARRYSAIAAASPSYIKRRIAQQRAALGQVLSATQQAVELQSLGVDVAASRPVPKVLGRSLKAVATQHRAHMLQTAKAMAEYGDRTSRLISLSHQMLEGEGEGTGTGRHLRRRRPQTAGSRYLKAGGHLSRRRRRPQTADASSVR